MYALRNLFDKEPAAIAEVGRQMVALLVAFAIVDWTDTQIVIVFAFVSGFLTLFVRAKSTPTAQLEENLTALADATSARPLRARKGQSGQVSIGGIVVAIVLAVLILWLLGVRL